MRKIKQQYGIKYPFMNDSDMNYFVDTNENMKDKIRSLITHIIFTPKGQKLRDPNFGTNLIKFIFENNDKTTFDMVKNEIIHSVSDYIKNVVIKDISILKSDNSEDRIYVKIIYMLNNGILSENDSFVIEL